MSITSDPLINLTERAREAVNLGRFEEAREVCNQIFSNDPGRLAALHVYISAGRVESGDPVFARIETYCKRTDLPAETESQLQFMRGKALDDLGRHEEAFEAFCKANTLKPVSFDAEGKKAYSQQLIKSLGSTPRLSLKPERPRMVFVLGMPRSGTTLMAQMLAAHPGIASLGERETLGPALTTLKGQRVRLHNFMRLLDESALHSARKIYLEGIPQELLDQILVDKMPENYWLAWAIPMLFPDALIIHMRRERLAVCWSCFRNDFGSGHEYSYDFNSLKSQYDTHIDLTNAWKIRDPNHWTDINLELLVQSPQDVLTPVLNRLGLDWSDACLAPEQTSGAVKTLSKWQVRAGIDPSIPAGWRAYLPMITDCWGDGKTQARAQKNPKG